MTHQYQRDTDQVHEIELESSITLVSWKGLVCPAGGTIGVEVFSHHVGANSNVEVDIKKPNGSTLETLSGVMLGNRFNGEYTFDEDEELGSYSLTARLPDHALRTDSTIPLNLVPRISVTNQAWSVEQVTTGDTVTLSADTENLADHSQVKITILQQDSLNAHDIVAQFTTQVRSNRIEVDWEFDFHRPRRSIPTQEETQPYGASYQHPNFFWTAEAYGQRFGFNQESGLLQFIEWIEIQLIGATSDDQYRLFFPDGSEREGSFDSNGVVRVNDAPPGSYRIEIVSEEEESDSDDESYQHEDSGEFDEEESV
ncbi:MAG: hypothetical protein OEZ47_03935 [Gammaproteobacteria bacterium]|nr:hypothetical protein [Gammaproteobacteria bacterium]